MKRYLVSLVFLVCVTPTQASIQNTGIDVANNGTQTTVGFFDESASGQELNGIRIFGFIPGESITFAIDTATIFGGGPITAAELFIDAFDVDFWNRSEVYIQGDLVGSLANTPTPSEIPVEAGPVGTHVLNDGFDVDNTFFDLAPYLSDLETDTTFTIRIKNTTLGFFHRGEEIRVDGINIQVDVADGVVPEPGTFVVWSLLGLTVTSTPWSRRRRN